MNARIAAILVLSCALPGCSKPERYESTRDMLGTFVSITLFADDYDTARKAGDAAFARIEQIERLMSSHRETSQISLLNKYGFQTPIPLDDDTLRVLQASIEYSKLTGGAFDATVGPLIELWRSAAQSGKLPDDAAIAKAMESVGYQHIVIDADAKTARFSKNNMSVDLGGIAKGYAVDAALEELRRHGITAALVNAGGDIAAMGAPPGKDAWRVGIQSPGGKSERLPGVIHLTGGAVATSGDYERYVEIEGKQYSHILDPRTGRPVERISSVTVIASDAMRADALATALSVLGPEEGLELAAKLDDVEAMYIRAPDTLGEKPAVVSTEGFQRFLEGATGRE